MDSSAVPELLQPLPALLWEPVFVLAFYWLALALGFRLLRWFKAPLLALTPWERGLVCAAVGTGALQLPPFLLSCMGWLTVSPVRVTVVALVLLLSRDLVHVARRLFAHAAQLRETKLSGVQLAWLGLLASSLGLLALRSMSLGDFGDDDGYHLTGPQRWLKVGSLVYLPSYSHTNASLGFEMLYLLAMAIAGARAAKLIHFGAGLMCLLGVYLAGRRLVPGPAKTLAGMTAVSMLAFPNRFFDFMFLMGVAYSDLAVCWLTIASLLLLLAWRENRSRDLLLVAAACGGFAASFKITALAVAAAIFGVVVAASIGKNGRKTRVIDFAAVVLLSGLPVLTWLYRAWRLTGNPVFPMFSKVIPTRDWSEEQGRVFHHFFMLNNWGMSYGERLSATARSRLLIAVGLLILLLSVVALLRTRRPARRDLLIFASVLSLSALGVTGLYLRFWLPAFMSLCLLFAAALAEKWSTRSWALVPALALTAAGIGLHLHARRPRLFDGGLAADLRMALGLSSMDQEYQHTTVWDMWNAIHATTPENAHILVAAFYTTFAASSGGAFWADRACYVTDSHLQHYIRFDDWEDFMRSIADAKIDYVLISREQYNAGRIGFTFPASQHEYPFSRRLAEEQGQLVQRFGPVELYRLRPIPQPVATRLQSWERPRGLAEARAPEDR